MDYVGSGSGNLDIDSLYQSALNDVDFPPTESSLGELASSAEASLSTTFPSENSSQYLSLPISTELSFAAVESTRFTLTSTSVPPASTSSFVSSFSSSSTSPASATFALSLAISVEAASSALPPILSSVLVESHYSNQYTYTNNSSTQQQLAVAGLSLALNLLVGAVLLSMTLGTVLGNAAIVAAVALERRLQNTCNIYVTSLATSDLLIVLVLMPISTIYELHGTNTSDFTTSYRFCPARLLF